MGNSYYHVRIVAFALVLVAFYECCLVSGNPITYVHVYVSNKIPGQTLGIRCRSKNDDLGVHYLTTNQYFKFQFKNSFWGITVFSCFMEYNDGRIPKSGNYEVYRESRDEARCGTNCFWEARPDGIYLARGLNGENAVFQYKWNPPRSTTSARVNE
ncbi:hypothetical protein AQUCO_00400050v1 [Aquilegia coerulea]|uniref:S-protein homolog n=1 Tax=Aquilegia coerulea TaxID=218851 RepID=A0A2G5ET48_AQUCA|nr:hypothetical protein AQUCO_00400050v1 [Aquilegia coerulea]